jgi:hypothetical protein
MKVFLAAVTALALLSAPAYAQGFGKGKGGHRSDQKTDTTKKTNDKDYKDALNKVPDQNQKVDPWAGVRPETSARTGH